MTLRIAVVCSILLLFRPASGATIEYRVTDARPGFNDTKNLVLLGQIEAGDAQKLVATLTNPKSRGMGRLVVNSPGGSVSEAIQIAKIVKSLYATVDVASHGRCASACFFIFLAGSGKWASPAELMEPEARKQNEAQMRRAGLLIPSGFVGLHRPFLTRIDSLSNKQTEGMRSVAAYLEGELLPRRLIDMMMSKPSNDIYWLTEQDLADIGDYPPEVEEYLIRKCGYDRNYISKVIEARNRGDSTTARKLLDQSNRAQVCTSQATSEAQEATLLKLRSGWLPY